MRLSIHDLPVNVASPESPETFFILAGYSWAKKDFRIWTIKFDEKSGQFIHVKAPTIKGTPIAVAGDDVGEIRKRIFDLMESRGKKKGEGMDMEPFEILRDKIREESNAAIGGPPQIVKVYEHMNTMPYGVLWPDSKSRQLTFLGRPLLNYELMPYPLLDPDTLRTTTTRIDNPEFPRDYDDGLGIRLP